MASGPKKATSSALLERAAAGEDRLEDVFDRFVRQRPLVAVRQTADDLRLPVHRDDVRALLGLHAADILGDATALAQQKVRSLSDRMASI